jgi:hypothetical protein
LFGPAPDAHSFDVRPLSAQADSRPHDGCVLTSDAPPTSARCLHFVSAEASCPSLCLFCARQGAWSDIRRVPKGGPQRV